MEGVAPPHCSACSFRKTLERTKINANKLHKHLTLTTTCGIIVVEDGGLPFIETLLEKENE